MRLVAHQVPGTTSCRFNVGARLFAGAAYQVKVHSDEFVGSAGSSSAALVSGYGTSAAVTVATASLAASDSLRRNVRAGTLDLSGTLPAVTSGKFVFRVTLGTDVIIHVPVDVEGVVVSASA